MFIFFKSSNILFESDRNKPDLLGYQYLESIMNEDILKSINKALINLVENYTKLNLIRCLLQEEQKINIFY